jgi:hypothetical protein
MNTDRPGSRRLRADAALFAFALTFLPLDTTTARAATAVVPTQYATIQAAIEAVEGDFDAVVRIDSNATFDEDLTIARSVAIEGGAGYLPTLTDPLEPSFSGPDAQFLTLRNLRLLPVFDQAMTVSNSGATPLTVTLDRVQVIGGDGVEYGAIVGSEGAGVTRVLVVDSSFRLEGDVSEDHLAISAKGTDTSLTVRRSSFVLSGGSAPPIAIVGAVRDLTIEDSLFLVRGEPLVGAAGLNLSATAEPTAPWRIERNEIVGPRGPKTAGIDLDLDESAIAVLANNVVVGWDNALFARAADSATLTIHLLNNTFDRALGSAVAFHQGADADLVVWVVNNLFTHSGAWAVIALGDLADLEFNASNNGFFANASGNLQPPLVSTNDVLADPLYVGDDDLRLRGQSPAIDAGFNTIEYLPDTDRLGQPRIQNGIIDLGAYEGGVFPITEVPTLDQWGLIGFASLLAAAALRLRRRLAIVTFLTAVAGLRALADARPAHADTAVVPADYATIQAAVDAVQGSFDALVRIDSNATFAERVRVAESVTIEAGEGFAPTIESIRGDFLGPDLAFFALRGIRFTSTTNRPIEIDNGGAAPLTATLDHVRVEHVYPTETGVFVDTDEGLLTRLVVLDSDFRTDGTTGDRNTDMSAIQGGGDEFELTVRRSTFSLRGVGKLRGVRADLHAAAIEDSRFLLAVPGDDTGRAAALEVEVVGTPTSPLRVERNEFRSTAGSSSAPAIEIDFDADASASFVDNVAQGWGSFLDAAPPEDAVVALRVVNNTVDSTFDGVVLRSGSDGVLNARLFNNLFTRTNAWGIATELDNGGTLDILARSNGFHSNGAGAAQDPVVSTDEIHADPLYLSGTDLRLQAASPMRDHGWNGADDLPLTDILGEPRVQNGVVDLGAYEGAVPALVEVPTLGEWGLAIFAALLALLGLRRRRSALGGALTAAAMAALGTEAARGATAVVPTDFATIQAAVTAVEGTPQALVRIESDAVFTETIVARGSVTIAGAEGFRPALVGTATDCPAEEPVPCVLSLQPSAATGTQFELRNVRLRTAPTGPSGYAVILHNTGAGEARLVLTDVDFDDDERAWGVLLSALGDPFAGTNHAEVRTSSARIGQSGKAAAVAFASTAPGSLELSGVRVTMVGAGHHAVGVRGTGTVRIADSVFDLTVPRDGSTTGLRFIGSTAAELLNNVFVLQAGEEAQIEALTFGEVELVRPERAERGAGSPLEHTAVVNLIGNDFVGSGEGQTVGVAATPEPNDTADLTIANNVFRGLTYPLSIAPRPAPVAPGAGEPGGFVDVDLTNNTIDRSSDVALFFSVQATTAVEFEMWNNLITRTANAAIEVGDASGVLLFAGTRTGYFGNGSNAPADCPTEQDVNSDPLYVGENDLRLRLGSPMIDSGDDNAVGLPATDRLGLPRIQGEDVDIGAYEGGQGAIVEVPALDGLGLALFVVALAAAACVRLLRRGAGAALLAVAIAGSATAETVRVPRDFAKIQDAIDAVQGTIDARVRIDSSRTFDETLRIEESVAIEAGARHRPTIRGAGGVRGACPADLGGNCVIDFRPAAGSDAVLALSGLTILPSPKSRPGDRLIQVRNLDGGIASLHLGGVALDNRNRAAHGIVVRQNAGENAVFLNAADTSFRLGGKAPTLGVAIQGAGLAQLQRTSFVMNAASSTAVAWSGPESAKAGLFVASSRFEIAATTANLASAHVVVDHAGVELADNTFLSRSGDGAAIYGLVHFGTLAGQDAIVDRNDFVHHGPGFSTAIELDAAPDRHIRARITNNVVRGQSYGVAVAPLESEALPGGETEATLINNTIDRSTRDAVSALVSPSTRVRLEVFNNLLTRNQGYGLLFQDLGGGGILEGGSNGYYFNGNGHVAGASTFPGDLAVNPRYVSETDLRLRATSPMRDSGGDAPGQGFTDRDGLPRFRNGRIDIGAYEYQAGSTP